MTHARLGQIAALAMLVAASAAFRHPLNAQTAQIPAMPTQQSVQLAFGYECGDRFVVRNDGTQPVETEYGVAGVPERSKLRLKEREVVELSSGSDKAVELWVNGGLVASALKSDRACATNQPNSAVVMRPIGAGTYVTNADPAYPMATQVVYLGAWPYYGFYPPFASIVVPFFPPFGGYGFVGFRDRGRFGR